MLNFEEIKRVPVLDVVRRYGVQLRGRGGWLHGKCPLPAHDSQRSASSFSVNVAGNFWLCFSDSCKAKKNGRQGGDVINLVSSMENCTEYEAAQKLAEWFNLNGTQKPQPKAEEPAPGKGTTEKLPADPTLAVPTVNKPLAFPGFKDVDPTHEYLRDRGIRVTTAEEFGVGYFAGRSSVIKDPYRIVIPIHNAEGELVAYAGRSLDPEAEDKYHLPSGFQKSLELYNQHNVAGDTVVVVEGFFSVLKLSQAGVSNSVALMGRTLSEAQEKALDRFERVVLMLDGDGPGREAVREIVPRLAASHWVRDVNPCLQPDSLSPEDLKQILSDAHAF